MAMRLRLLRGNARRISAIDFSMDEESDMAARRQRIQRWIGVAATGDLNDAATVAELEKDIVGLGEYLGINRVPKATPIPPLIGSGEPRMMVQKTPNQGGRIRPEGVVFHHSSGSEMGTIDWISQSRSKVSYHYLICRDGEIWRFVEPTRAAWHAGKSVWKGRRGCNQFMLGISFAGDTYQRTLERAELDSAAWLINSLKGKFGWTLGDMTDHRQVSPGRKNDLAPAEWDRLRTWLGQYCFA